MIKRIVVLTLLLTTYFGQAQTSIADISKEDYLLDFDILVGIIKKQHPNPFRFIDEKTFDQKVKAMRKRLETSPNYGSFYMNNPISLINDAHSNAYPDMLHYGDYVKTVKFFPLKVDVYNNKVYVNQFGGALPNGAELLKINKQEISKWLERMPISADASIPSSNSISFSSGISALNPQAQYYTIEYTLDGKEVKTIELEPVGFDRFFYNSEKSVFPIDIVSSSWLVYGRKYNEEVYLLTLSSFNLTEEYAYYYLNRIFKEIKDAKIKHLIIDIRDNSGGLLSNIPLFYSFIAKDKIFKNNYRYATKVVDINVRNYLVDENERQVSGTDIVSLNNFMHQRFDKDEASGYYFGNNRLDESYVENFPQDKNAFTGEVTLLINNQTISAATYFASLFKESDRGEIVGYETSTCSNFTTAAWFLTYKLPNTGYSVSIPRSEVFFNGSTNSNNKECRGVIPDYIIDNAAYQKGLQDVKDPFVEKALELISKSK